MRNQRGIMMDILSRRIRRSLRVFTEVRFLESKEWLLNAVASHDISRDINSHSPSSRLGSSSGTLYGFIGFDANDQPDPVQDLIDFLDENIRFRALPPARNRLFSSTVAYPAKTAFNIDVFQLDWTSRGWPIMIEEGISGLPYYLNKGNGTGRSEEGVQASKPVRNSDWRGEAYLTPLLSEFRKRLLVS